MRWIQKKTELAGVVLALLAAATGCKQSIAGPTGERRDVPPQRGGVLRTAFFTDVRGLDPATAFATTSAAVNNLIFDTLVTYDEQGELIPGLAEYEVAPDGRRHDFKLRHGVIFHDGKELEATDVKRTIERALHPNTPCPATSFFNRIEGFDSYRKGKAPRLSGVRVQGKYAFSITLREPDSTFLHVLAMHFFAPVCRSAGATYDKSFAHAPCGTGPFKLVHFENGQEIRLKRHEGFWQPGKPYLDGVTFYLSMPGLTQRYKLEDGAIDYMRDFSEVDSRLFRSDPRWRGQGAWEEPHTVFGLFMNTEMPPFDNRHIRRAVSLALNRKQVATLRDGHLQPAHFMVPESIRQPKPGEKGQRQDYAAALKEMELAGYPYNPETGEGGYPEEIPYLALIDSLGSQTAEVYQQQLARIGIRIRLRLVGWPTFLAQTGRRGAVPMGTAGWHADYPEPSDFFEPILTTAAIADENSQNSAFFSNAELDELMKRARRSTDPSARDGMYRRAEEIIAQEAPWVITLSQRFFELWQPYVHGYTPHPALLQYVRHAWLDRSQMKKTASLGECQLPLPRRLGRCGRRGPRSTLALALGGAR